MMGLDARILFQAEGEDIDFSELTYAVPEWKVLEVDPHSWIKDDYPEATHELDCDCRYYEKNHRRGPWTKLCAALMTLHQIPEVKQIWYGSDCSSPYECPPERILEISKAYMGLLPKEGQ